MRIVFVCEANSTRSQLAEGLAKRQWQHFHPLIESCGSFDGGGINPVVRQILIANKIDCNNQHSKHYSTLEAPQTVDWVIILCGRDFIGDFFSNAKKIHQPVGIPGIGFANNNGIFDAYQNLAGTIKKLLINIEKIIFEEKK